MAEPVARLAQPNPADPFALPPIAPSPAGPLVITAACRTARTGGSVTHHEVTIEADWSVRTPHDIELERIATALGGYLSCVELVDREVPALAELMQLRARRVLPRITRRTDGCWTSRALAPDCQCEYVDFHTAVEAAEHVRDPLHVARVHGTEAGQLRWLHAAVTQAHGTDFYLPPYDDCGAGQAVRERDGVAQLWEAGVHPRTVGELHRALWPGGSPLPLWFYLGAVSRGTGLARAAVAAARDEGLAARLCWTDTELDRTHPDARAAWLRAGIPRKAIDGLAGGAFTPVDVARLAARTRRSITSAAATLAAWHRAGCHPSLEDLVLLDGSDPWYEPSAGAVDWLWDRIGNARTGPTRTQIGLMLAACGTRATTLSLLAQGIRDPGVAARLVNGAESAMIGTTTAAVTRR
ncbi:hypothetical protein BH20ACT5_BH20ACT5_14640 [soil metagenome]